MKESAGKALNRRTETAYEAAMPGEEANIFPINRAEPFGCHYRLLWMGYDNVMMNELEKIKEIGTGKKDRW